MTSYIADLVFGDPEKLPHPTRMMGKFILFSESVLRGESGKSKECAKGAFLAILVIGLVFSVSFLIFKLLSNINPFLGFAFLAYLGYTTIAVKDMRDKAGAVMKALNTNDMNGARGRLSMIVGRDTAKLDEKDISTAAVESVAESVNDGIVAPIFYFIIGGPLLAIVYKAINTLDSMLGYKNERYIHFGWFPARLDDVANFIPARISAFLIAVAAAILKKDFNGAFDIMLRDGNKHESPNSGLSEAAMSGALGVRLGGNAYYEGELCVRPYIGEGKRQMGPHLIKEALDISFVVSVLIVVTGVIIRCVI